MGSTLERKLLFGRQLEKSAFVGKKKVETPLIRVTDFNETFVEEYDRLHVHDIPEISGAECFRWISVYGLHDTRVIRDLGKRFNINNLILKNILNTRRRPRLDDFDNYTFLSIRLLQFNSDDDTINDDLLSILIGENILLTFHERPIALFALLRKQLKTTESKLRKGGVGYLLYKILDCVIDNYSIAVDEIEEKIEKWDETLTDKPSVETLSQLVKYKKAINYLQKSVDPAYKHIFGIEVLKEKFLPDFIQPFFHDLKSHFTHVKEQIDYCNSTLINYLQFYHTRVGIRVHNYVSLLLPIAIIISLTIIVLGVLSIM